MRTFEVVPSPVMSSCAVATLAIREAVGCWICCDKNKLNTRDVTIHRTIDISQ